MVNYMSVNGAELAYDEAGSKDVPLMITLHGGRGMGQMTKTSYHSP